MLIWVHEYVIVCDKLGSHSICSVAALTANLHIVKVFVN